MISSYKSDEGRRCDGIIPATKLWHLGQKGIMGYDRILPIKDFSCFVICLTAYSESLRMDLGATTEGTRNAMGGR